MQNFNFRELFCQENQKKDNFLSRVFGIFSEEIVDFWLANRESKYVKIGRPTLYKKEMANGISTQNKKENSATLDFLIMNKNDGKYFIVEQKNFLAYKKGTMALMNEDADSKFMVNFEGWSKAKRKSTLAWDFFLDFSSDKYIVKYNQPIFNDKKGKIVRSKSVRLNPDAKIGKVLLWSSFNKKGKAKIIHDYGFDDILSLEKIISDLIKWNDEDYFNWLVERSNWTSDLFNILKAGVVCKKHSTD